ncbi:MAG TPA: putative aminohydrolase SsnA [Caldilineae bacterium]|nr:putative aminohydrolase SsnA [Caldilineae bacterium]
MYLIVHGTVVTMDERMPLVEDGAVLIRGDTIEAVGASTALTQRYPDAERLDAHGQWIMPGNICAHTHFYGLFARGMALPGAPRDFPEILRELWWPLDRALRPEGIRLSALMCLADAIRHGTTTLIDHHASQACVDGSLDMIAEAVEEAGLRACLCYEVSDRAGSDVAAAGIRENVRWLKRIAQEKPPRLAGLFGLHASLSLSDETLARCVAEAQALGDVGFHLHAAEGPADQEDSLRRYGLRVIERLARHGILGPHTIIAHAVDVDPWEMALLRETDTWVAHQPRSNMNNAVGTADVPSMLRGGIRVALGNDGFSNDMFEEMKAAYLIHKAWRRDPRVMSADHVMRLAYENNARLATQIFGRPIGRLSPGSAADVILVDYRPPTPVTPENIPWHIIFGVNGGQVTTTICDGRILMRDREILMLDVEAIAAAAREEARRTWARYAELAR